MKIAIRTETKKHIVIKSCLSRDQAARRRAKTSFTTYHATCYITCVAYCIQYVYMHVCMHIYIYIYVYLYIYIYIERERSCIIHSMHIYHTIVGGETESQGVRPRLRLCLPPQQRGAASEDNIDIIMISMISIMCSGRSSISIVIPISLYIYIYIHICIHRYCT